MKRKACMIITLLTIIITGVNIGYAVKDEFFYNLNSLPEGKLLRNEINQNVLFSEGIYLSVYEIAPTSEHPAAIRVVAKNDSENEERTIYWQIGTQGNLIYWPEDQDSTVIINGVPVNYKNGFYDCRDYENFTYTETESNTQLDRYFK